MDRTAWIVLFVAGVAIGRYVLPRATAEAKPIEVTREVVREVEAQPTRVLTEVLRCATQLAREELEQRDELGDEDTGDHPVTGDGLTDEERWESVVAEVEDALPRDRGAIQGQVRDESTGEALAGVTVVVAGPDMDGTQTAITDDNGFYLISGLPAGNRYLTTFYYLETTVERSGVAVGAGKVSPVFQKIAPTGPRIEGTGQGITITDDYTRNIYVPIEGFSDEDDDSLGVTFSSSHPIDNVYIVEE